MSWKDFFTEDTRDEEPKKNIPAIIFSSLLVLGAIAFFFLQPVFKLKQLDPVPVDNVIRYEVSPVIYIPYESITLERIDGDTVLREDIGTDTTLLIGDNGNYTVTVRAVNGQTYSQSIEVSGIDLVLPTITTPILENGMVTITVADEGSGINYSRLTITDSDNQNVPFTYDETTGVVTYSQEYPVVHVTVYDNTGNSTVADLSLTLPH